MGTEGWRLGTVVVQALLKQECLGDLTICDAMSIQGSLFEGVLVPFPVQGRHLSIPGIVTHHHGWTYSTPDEKPLLMLILS